MSENMTLEEFDEIMWDDDQEQGDATDGMFLGLVIMRKYIPDADVHATARDEVYGGMIKELVEAGISREDVAELRKLGWRLAEGDCLHYYV